MAARAMTAGEKASVRTDGQGSRLYLALHSPTVVLTARLNGAPASNDQVVSLSIDTVVGTLADVLVGMTLWVGTSTWAWDKGTCRIRKAPVTSTLYISDTSDIDWDDNDYLTVVAEYRLWPRHLLVVGETGVWMDYDVAYTDQHTYPAPIVNMGPDVVAWADDVTELATVDFDGSASTVLWGSIASVLWECVTADSITDEDTYTPQMVFPTGTHDVSCTLTTAAGKTHTGHRTVFVFHRLSMPITQFTLNGPAGTSFGGGPSFGVTLFAEANIDDIPPCAKAILFSRDWYEDTEGSYGPNSGRDNILAAGWVVNESITIDPDTGDVSFDVTGLDDWMQRTPMLATGLMDTDFADGGGGWPNRWVEMNDLTVDKIVWHILHWRSTTSIFTDIFLSGDTRQAGELSASGQDLWSQLQEIPEAKILATPTVDRFGALHVTVNQAFLPESDRGSIPTVMSLEGQDWSSLTVTRRDIPEYYKVRVSGVEYSAGTGVPIGAISPGFVPASRGQQGGEFNELVMGTQAEALTLAGVIAGAGAAEIESLEITLAENNRFFDVAPHQWASITLAEPDTVRGAPAGTFRLIVREVRYEYSEDGYITTSLVCEGEGGTWPAIPMVFPGDDEPGIEPPPEPPPDEPPPPDPIDDGGGGEDDPGASPADVITALGSDVLTTEDFSAGSPSWDTELGSGPTAMVGTDVATDKSAYYVIEDESVWKSTDFKSAGVATWSEVATASDLPAAGGQFLAIRCSAQHVGLVYVLAVDGDGMTYCGRSSDAGGSWVWNEVATQTGKNYTVTFRSKLSDVYEGGFYYIATTTHARLGDDTATYNPLGFAVKMVTRGGNLDTGATTINDNQRVGGCLADTVMAYANNYPAQPTPPTAFDTALTDYFGAGNYTYFDVMVSQLCTKSVTKVNIRTASGFSLTHTQESWVFWDKDSYPQALAVAPTNDNYVYIGTKGGIYKSIDGGYTWSTLTGSYGANDVYSPWGLAGVVYFWATDGRLGYFDADTEMFLDITEAVPEQTAGRIGIFGGKLYVLTGGKLRMKNLGSWSDLKTGLENEQGLRIYASAAGTLIFVETGGVWYSNDGGTTWSDKQGDITSLSNALTVHLL